MIGHKDNISSKSVAGCTGFNQWIGRNGLWAVVGTAPVWKVWAELAIAVIDPSSLK
jgi:hypothetical protein